MVKGRSALYLYAGGSLLNSRYQSFSWQQSKGRAQVVKEREEALRRIRRAFKRRGRSSGPIDYRSSTRTAGDLERRSRKGLRLPTGNAASGSDCFCATTFRQTRRYCLGAGFRGSSDVCTTQASLCVSGREKRSRLRPFAPTRQRAG